MGWKTELCQRGTGGVGCRLLWVSGQTEKGRTISTDLSFEIMFAQFGGATLLLLPSTASYSDHTIAYSLLRAHFRRRCVTF